jgi:hypothetical protein
MGAVDFHPARGPSTSSMVSDVKPNYGTYSSSFDLDPLNLHSTFSHHFPAPSVAISALGKMLLAVGYLVLDRAHTMLSGCIRHLIPCSTSP